MKPCTKYYARSITVFMGRAVYLLGQVFDVLYKSFFVLTLHSEEMNYENVFVFNRGCRFVFVRL